MHIDTHRLKFLGALVCRFGANFCGLPVNLLLDSVALCTALSVFCFFMRSLTSLQEKVVIVYQQLALLPASSSLFSYQTYRSAASREALRSVGFSMRRLFNTWKQTADVVESMPNMRRSNCVAFTGMLLPQGKLL